MISPCQAGGAARHSIRAGTTRGLPGAGLVPLNTRTAAVGCFISFFLRLVSNRCCRNPINRDLRSRARRRPLRRVQSLLRLLAPPPASVGADGYSNRAVTTPNILRGLQPILRQRTMLCLRTGETPVRKTGRAAAPSMRRAGAARHSIRVGTTRGLPGVRPGAAGTLKDFWLRSPFVGPQPPAAEARNFVA